MAAPLIVRWLHRVLFGDDRTIMLASPSVFARRAAHRVPAERAEARVAAQDLDVTDRRRAAGSAAASHRSRDIRARRPGRRMVNGSRTRNGRIGSGGWRRCASATSARSSCAATASRMPRQRGRPQATGSRGKPTEGFILVSPDGTGQRVLSDEHWLAHTWSHDGTRIFGIRETERSAAVARLA